LEVATATLLEAMTGRQLAPIDKALLCQQAEQAFAGMPCGIMDQFITAMGQAGSALLIDCRGRTMQAVPLDDPAVSVLIINSNVKHELVDGAYAERRRQCERAAEALGVSALRDATMPLLHETRDQLDPVTYRRARHVISENERTTAAAEAMQQRNWSGVGRLMGESHASLRDDFEVSCAELDTLVELAEAHATSGDLLGARMTGGGFGGCTVSLVKTDAATHLGQQIATDYEQRTGQSPSVFVTRPAAGARSVEL
jgi:galactokinase